MQSDCRTKGKPPAPGSNLRKVSISYVKPSSIFRQEHPAPLRDSSPRLFVRGEPLRRGNLPFVTLSHAGTGRKLGTAGRAERSESPSKEKGGLTSLWSLSSGKKFSTWIRVGSRRGNSAANLNRRDERKRNGADRRRAGRPHRPTASGGDRRCHLAPNDRRSATPHRVGIRVIISDQNLTFVRIATGH